MPDKFTLQQCCGFKSIKGGMNLIICEFVKDCVLHVCTTYQASVKSSGFQETAITAVSCVSFGPVQVRTGNLLAPSLLFSLLLKAAIGLHIYRRLTMLQTFVLSSVMHGNA